MLNHQNKNPYHVTMVFLPSFFESQFVLTERTWLKSLSASSLTTETFCQFIYSDLLWLLVSFNFVCRFLYIVS